MTRSPVALVGLLLVAATQACAPPRLVAWPPSEVSFAAAPTPSARDRTIEPSERIHLSSSETEVIAWSAIGITIAVGLGVAVLAAQIVDSANPEPTGTLGSMRF